MSGAGVRYRTNPRFVPAGVSLRFGGGGDASLGSDGTDLELLLSATADLMIGRVGAPSPDSLLHLWSGTAGTVAAAGDSLFTVEGDGAATFGVLVPAASFGGLRVGFPPPGAGTDAYLLYYGPSATPSDAWLFGIDGATRLQYSGGAFAFQEATAISTAAGDLTLNPAGDVVIPAGDVLSVDDTTESTSVTTGSIHTAGGLGVVKDLFVGNDIYTLGDRLIIGPTVGQDRHKQVIRGVEDVGSGAAVEIIANDDAGTGVLAVVTGRSESGSHFFKDLLLTGFNTAPTVVSAKTVNNSPAARTYTNGTGYAVELQMASGTYNVAVWILQGDNTA